MEKFKFAQWKSRGKMIRASLHITGDKGIPWVIFCHGFTGQRTGPAYLFVKISRALAQRGIASCRFDFAGSGESDGSFADMTVATMYGDALCAAKYISKKYDPSHVLLLGHSFGGMIASLCAHEARAAGLILLSPVADPNGMADRRRTIIQTGPNKDGFYENGPHEMSIGFLGSLKSADPIGSLAAGFRGALLLFQGGSDQSISIKESRRYVHWARKAGIDTQYHIFPKADHNYSAVSQVKSLCSIIGAWAKERYL